MQLWVVPVLKICLESQQRSLLFVTMLRYLNECCNDVASRKQQWRCPTNHFFQDETVAIR